MAPPVQKQKPFQLLEINIISAQDLEPISKKMCTYAKAWVHPTRKLSSCMDTEGNNNPTWNDKFVFRVDEAFLRGDTSAVMIEIYTPNWFRDVVVGTVRVLVGNLIPPPAITGRHHIGMRFVALQVRRPSGRPQGILNIGVTVLDGSLRSMPLYNDCVSAVGYRDLMDMEPQKQNQNDDVQDSPAKPIPMLRRSRSERSERLAFDNFSCQSSMVGIPIETLPVQDGSILSISEFVDPFMGKKKKGKASSVINGSELMREKPKHRSKKGKASSVISGAELKERETEGEKDGSRKGKKGKKSSVLSFNKRNSPSRKIDDEQSPDEPIKNVVEEKSVTENKETGKQIPKFGAPKGSLPLQPMPWPLPTKHMKGSSVLSNEQSPLPWPLPSKHVKGGSILSVGPSPSVVAGMMAAERRYPLDNESSVLDGWSLNESVEGMKSKLERWRTELPPLYDHHGYGSSAGSYRSSAHTRRRSDGGSGLFSCFGNICGYECQCTCGKPSGRKSHGGKYLSSSVGSTGRSFL